MNKKEKALNEVKRLCEIPVGMYCRPGLDDSAWKLSQKTHERLSNLLEKMEEAPDNSKWSMACRILSNHNPWEKIDILNYIFRC